MKRLWMGGLALGFVAALGGSTPARAADKSLKIAMILWRGETGAERGFKDGLKELGYSVRYTVMHARQDARELGRLLRKELVPRLQDFDYVYTYGTTVSKRAKVAIRDRVPQLFNIVADPVGAGIVPSLEDTGGNITGATHLVPTLVQIESALNFIRFKRLGILFNSREKNSNLQREELRRISKRLGFEVVDLRSPPALDALQKNLQNLVDGAVAVDAVYLPSDSFLASKAKLIGSRLREAKVKSIGSTKVYVVHGVLTGVVPDYYMVGKMVAGIVDRHQKGEKLEDIPVLRPYRKKTPVVMINRTTSRILNLRIPEGLGKKAVLVD